MRHKPTYKDTSQEANDWQEELACDEVEQIENGHIKEEQVAPRPQRQ